MYKVIFKTSNGITVVAHMDDMRTAYEFAVDFDGIVLHGKKQ